MVSKALLKASGRRFLGRKPSPAVVKWVTVGHDGGYTFSSTYGPCGSDPMAPKNRQEVIATYSTTVGYKKMKTFAGMPRLSPSSGL